MRIPNILDLREWYKNLDFEIIIDDFNFHHLLESNWSFTYSNIVKSYQTEFNSKKVLEKFEWLMETAKFVTLQ